MTEWLLLLLSVSLMFACGVFVAAEYAFVTVDRATIERAAAAGDRSAAGTLKALRTLSTQLSGAQLDHRGRECLDHLVQAADHINTLIDELLDLARM